MKTEQEKLEDQFDPTGVKKYIDGVLGQISANPSVTVESKQEMGLCFFDVKEWMEKNGDENLKKALVKAYKLGVLNYSYSYSKSDDEILELITKRLNEA